MRRQGIYAVLVLLITGAMGSTLTGQLPAAPGRPLGPPPGAVTFIDTHTHLESGPGRPPDFAGAQSNALTLMEQLGIQKAVIMPPPAGRDLPGQPENDPLTKAVQAAPTRFAFLSGGRSLLAAIIQTPESGEVSTEIRRSFEARAEEIVRAGAAGFGEMAALHLSFLEGHPFVAVPPDHPLFLLLADLAARHDVVIDLHLEPVVQDIPSPSHVTSPLNPQTLRENMRAFERLLSHNRRARIVWAHVGWDNIGHMTIALLRRTLESHPNLFMQIKIEFLTSLPQNRPLDEGGRIRPEWVELIRAFSDRFVIGTDSLYGEPRVVQRHTLGPRSFLNQLPQDLARKVGLENAVRIYKLK